MKKLSEMTLEELWQLFPIILTEHKDYWAQWYDEEGRNLKKILPKSAQIYHIGSTAVKGIWAKPIIDILVEVPHKENLQAIAKTIQCNGYIIMSDNSARISFNKGYTADGYAEKVFHLHLQHTSEKDEVLFKDYLNLHFDIAKEYEQLKLQLWKKYEYDRDAYTQAKGEFVSKYTAIAKSRLILDKTQKN